MAFHPEQKVPPGYGTRAFYRAIDRDAPPWDAVPVEQPGLVSTVLTTVDEVFGRAAYELRLHRQAPVAPAAQARGVARARQESLSWT